MRTRYPCNVDILLIVALAFGLYLLFVPFADGVRQLFAGVLRDVVAGVALVGR